MSHAIIPNSRSINVDKDRSFVWRVFIVFIDCGRYAKVVQNAANKPITVIMFISKG